MNPDGEATSVIDPGEDPAEDNSFDMPVMVIEGAWTGDGRYINPGALTWRDLPIPTMALTSTTNSHDGADLVGKLDTIDRRAAGPDDLNSKTGAPYGDTANILFANGQFDTADNAAEIKRLVSGQFLRGVSVDIGDTISELVWLDIDGNECPESDDEMMDLFDLLFGFAAAAEPQPGEPYSMGEKILQGRIMGATICPFPAFEGAYVTIGDVIMSTMVASIDEPDPKIGLPSINIVDRQGERKMPNGLTASAAPMVPPATWFVDPKFTEPTAITILESGEIFGHLALWSECHMSYTSQCINAPRSLADYAYFRTGCVLCDDGDTIPTGVITLNTGHAELWQDASSAKAHYDNTGTVAADIAAGDDALGIWVHGSLRPDVDELTIRRLRGSALSGDWRELVAALAVNVPGFPVKRPTARTAGGSPTALVAAGRLTQRDAARFRALQSSKDNLSQDDMAVLAAYVRRDLRSQVHREGR
jgi:hypothetical protein